MEIEDMSNEHFNPRPLTGGKSMADLETVNIRDNKYAIPEKQIRFSILSGMSNTEVDIPDRSMGDIES